MKTTQLLIVLLLVTISVKAQKELKCNPITAQIKIDGKLTELVWKQHLENGNFKQLSPNNGKAHSNQTKIAIAYDTAFFYVAAELSTTRINKNLSARDDIGTSDYFGLIIDLFGANREGWAFLVTPSNVQTDIKITNTGNYGEWNAVWESAVQIHKDTWTIEFKIPFNSLRFPKDDLSNIQINFERFDAHTNEDSFWNYVDSNVNGFLNQFGKLKGVEKIDPPINLSFNPFVSIVNEKSPNGESKTTFNGGLDLKYVHNNAYTLDLSLIPDFSQAPSDDQIFNLSPFEIKYNENRQFFVEGTEIFDKGAYLYTRRIGGTPIDKNKIQLHADETIANNPISSNILNLIKFTGKSKNGLSIGFLNGITAKSEAEIKNTITPKTRKVVTNPITNYNAIVVDQALKNNSSLTFINNSVLRNGTAYDSNLTALLYRWYNKKRTYSMYFKKAVSQKYYSEKENQFGHQYYGYLGKISGKFQAGITANLVDDTFDNNDFGYLSRNNQFRFRTELSYTENAPKNIFSSYRFYADHQRTYYHRLFEKETSYYKVGSNGTFKKNNHTFFIDFTYYEKGKNFYETRTKDRFFNTPESTLLFVEYQTNRNKNVSFAGYTQFTTYINTQHQTTRFATGYGVRARIGQHLYFYLNQSYENSPNSLGYLTSQNNAIIFGQRSLKILNNAILLNYTINAKLNISTRLRHYWVQVDYSKQFELLTNGNLTANNFTINPNDYDDNYNSFSVDFLTKWQFAPGSEMSLGYKLGANYYDSDTKSSYLENLKSTLNENSSHTVSLKMTYFLDYNTLKTKKMF